MLTKQELRAEIRQQKKAYTPEQLNRQSGEIMQRFLSHRKVMEARNVLMYYSLPDEVNTHEALTELLKQGKRVFLPKVVDDEHMVVCSYRGESDLAEGPFHIKEPTGEQCVSPTDIDVVAVPGMSFDEQHHRLGRGKGYYDRFLALLPQTYKIGVCFDFQKRRMIPVDKHDIKMDEII